MTIRYIALILFALCCLTPASACQTKVERPLAVSAAHPLAVEAGMDVLRRSGDAVDAAIAVQAMLGLVEPQSSGLGGYPWMAGTVQSQSDGRSCFSLVSSRSAQGK